MCAPSCGRGPYLLVMTQEAEPAGMKGLYLPQENQRHAGGGISSV
jgi:hypothetical protein